LSRLRGAFSRDRYFPSAGSHPPHRERRAVRPSSCAPSAAASRHTQQRKVPVPPAQHPRAEPARSGSLARVFSPVPNAPCTAATSGPVPHSPAPSTALRERAPQGAACLPPPQVDAPRRHRLPVPLLILASNPRRAVQRQPAAAPATNAPSAPGARRTRPPSQTAPQRPGPSRARALGQRLLDGPAPASHPTPRSPRQHPGHLAHHPRRAPVHEQRQRQHGITTSHAGSIRPLALLPAPAASNPSATAHRGRRRQHPRPRSGSSSPPSPSRPAALLSPPGILPVVTLS